MMSQMQTTFLHSINTLEQKLSALQTAQATTVPMEVTVPPPQTISTDSTSTEHINPAIDAISESLKTAFPNNTAVKLPLFYGVDATYKDWYNKVLAILAVPPLYNLYDSTQGDVVEKTTPENLTMSQKFFASLLTSFKDTASTIMLPISTLHHGQGVELLRAMIPIFRPT